MNKFALKLGLVLAASMLVAGATSVQAKPRETGEQLLAKRLEGRVPGRPVDCLSQAQRDSVEIIDRTALIYGSGRTIYVNRPRHPDSLDRDDILVTRITGSQLCKLDLVRLQARSSNFASGFVTLEEFVPYRRVPTPRN
ncbi:MAG: hypothetical protein JWQ16_817 [Novosphingobium sp.]|nr:hypothetical protein [Novosphingobium sp.]